jgi:hypothetical protein
MKEAGNTSDSLKEKLFTMESHQCVGECTFCAIRATAAWKLTVDPHFGGGMGFAGRVVESSDKLQRSI